MKNLLFYLALVIQLTFGIFGDKQNPTQEYQNEVILDTQDFYYLYWSVEGSSITFEVHVKNSTWFIFGISSDNFSDVVVGWLNEDTIGHFSDRKLIVNNQLKPLYLEIDTQTDWFPLYAAQIDEYLIFKFKRKLTVVCSSANQDQDLDIGSGPTSVVFSSFTTDNTFINNVHIDYFDDEVRLERLTMKTLTLDNGLLANQNTDEIVISCPAIAPIADLQSQPTGYYTHSIDLVQGAFKFYWNYTDTDFIGEIHCLTDGWVGFGLSPTGDMAYSDVIIGWIDSNGNPIFTDRHIDINRKVLVDEKQDWNLLSYSKSNGITVFKFYRKIKTCDADDRDIEVGTPNLIYAWGTTQLSSTDDISYHFMNRGTKQVNLISETKRSNDYTGEIQYINFNVNNVILPPESTFYYCKGFKIPQNLEKRHILKWELKLPNINFENIHHALVYECDLRYNGSVQYSSTGQCNSNRIKTTYCSLISLGWAIGGDLLTAFPETTGYPIGGDTDYKYFFFEIHYNNPEQKIGYIDSVSLRYHTTTDLMENELGVMTLGTIPSPTAMVIPPGTSRLTITGHCFKECTTETLEDRNYTIVMSFPHTHLTGTEIYTELVRDGVNLGSVFENKYYNFDFQKTFSLNPFVNITRGDQLVTKCTYNTLNRDKFTYGGDTTQDEMCLNFLTYFPRSKSLKNVTGDVSLSPRNRSIVDDYTAIYLALTNLGSTTKDVDRVREKIIDFYNTTRYSAGCTTFSDFRLGPYDDVQSTRIEVPDSCSITTEPTNPDITEIFLYIVEIIWEFLLNILSWIFGDFF